MCRMNNERLLLLLDLEGVAGFSYSNELKKNWEYAKQEVEVTLRALREHGVEAITMCVIHNDGTGFPDGLLPQYDVRLFEGVDQLPEAINGVRWAFLLGFHGMRDTGGAFDHSFRLDFLDLQYDGQHLGEIGIFSRWFLRRGVTPLLVSGEGNFRHEMKGIPCVFHAVPPNLKEPSEIEAVYENLREAVDKALQNRESDASSVQINDGPLIVQVTNIDKYALLADCPYLRVESDRFVFASIESYLENLYPFCLRLNEAGMQIVKENIAFFDRVKDCASEERLRELLHDYLRRDIETINRAERQTIAEKVGISYETV